MAVSENPQSKETLQAVESWIELRKERPHNRTGPTSKNRVGNVLRFLGVPYENEQQFTRQEEGSGSRSVHFTFDAGLSAVEGVKGAPLFGSLTKGIFHVFCLWEDARPDRLRQNPTIRRLSQNGQNAVIVLYLNALTDAERQDIRRASWSQDISVAVLDEILFECLARADIGAHWFLGNRLRDFLAVALPYTAANPYNPETTGWGARVPREMFYGREELANNVMKMRDGTSILFGGRQLGKTALLRHVEETFSQPVEKQFAWFVDLKDRGYVPTASSVTAKEPSDIFKIIHEQFCSENLLASRATDENPDQIRQDILTAFRNDQQLQVLAMFDESDSFLQSDWVGSSTAVESMRALMNDTFNRFKVVFAGLHNVQRFAGRPNSPFSNLGFNPNRPRRGGIGPLSDHEARQLVEEPCSLLGFRFEQLAVDKILSYTNRHPSLIQFFCHELIQTWRTDHLDGKPPFHVGIADVDKVYRKKSIQEGIRRRFEETFKLDPRYHVISLTMIYFQERPTQKWTMEELRECCQCWCPLTFDPDNLEGLELQSLLDELVGLGILAEDGSAYRMRSSLISQMFGSRAEVERTLQELEAAEPLETSTAQLGIG